MKRNSIYLIILALVGMCGCHEEKEVVDSIYYGGDILTMKGETPAYVEALVEKDGKIVFVGDINDALNRYSGIENDLKGNTMLPGFIDAHGHVFMAGFQSLAANLLPPPDGNASNIESLVDITKR